MPILLILSAFFSGSETALFNLSKLERMQFARGGATDKLVTQMLSETRQILITLLLGNMTVNVSYFAISSALSLYVVSGEGGHANRWLVPLITIGSLIAIILLGEVLPKLIAVRASVASTKFIAVPLFLVHRLIAPIRWFAAWFVITPLARLLAPRDSAVQMTQMELESLLQLSQRRGVIDSDEEGLLQQVFELAHIKVRDLMIPRVDMHAFDISHDANKLVDLITNTRLRHIPVFEGDLDNVIGVASSRTILLKRPQNQEEMRTLISDVLFVPEQQRAEELLKYLRENIAAFAIVVDEYGGTAGLITIEDVVEHMVGEIAGGYEKDGEPEVEKIDECVWRVSADLPIHDWHEFFGRNEMIKQYSVLDEVSTIAGLVLAVLGRLAVKDDEITIGKIVIRVDVVEKNRIRWVTVSLREDQDGGEQ
ncbi:HlyC/CorC family transporter [Planctomycetota bacterium]|nr:HlyC/CorC family transporter [Planctomycetota bacterium]